MMEVGAIKNIEINSKIEKIDYDDLLSTAGEFGLYQMFLFLSTFPFYVFGVFVYFNQMFMTEVSSNHWCWVPELVNLSEIERRNLAIPMDIESKFGYSRCEVYVANWTEVLESGMRPNESWSREKCSMGWEFDKNEIPYATISSDLGWVCDKDSYQATAQSIFFAGSVAGGIVIGWIADRYGRLPAAVISNIIGCVAGIISTFVTNFSGFAATRFFVGFSYDNCMMMTYLLVLEYVAPKYRSLIANLPFAIFYAMGAISLPFIALACGHWKILSLVTSIPLALSLLAPFILPESPRWLLSKGRVDEAVDKLIKIGKINKKEIPLKMIEDFKISTGVDSEVKGSIKDLFTRPLLRKIFVLNCLEYMCCMIVFDSLIRTVDQLNYNFFISFAVVSATEFPSLMILAFILDYTGRKLLSVVALFTTLVFCIASILVSDGLPSVICVVIARFTVNMACNTSMQWTVELLPTPVRGSGASIVHICGYLATIVTPFIAYSEKVTNWLPLFIVGCIAAIGSIISTRIPETAQKELPQTFENAEALIKSSKFIEIPFLNKKRIIKTTGNANETFEM